jgi:ATP-dependent Lon protease
MKENTNWSTEEVTFDRTAVFYLVKKFARERKGVRELRTVKKSAKKF